MKKNMPLTFLGVFLLAFSPSFAQKGEINALINKYMLIKAYLEQDEGAKVAEAAAHFVAAWFEVPISELSPEKQQVINEIGPRLLIDVGRMGEENATDYQRFFFKEFSANFFFLLKNLQMHDAPIYLMHSDKGEGSWLSLSERSGNPYLPNLEKPDTKVLEVLK